MSLDLSRQADMVEFRSEDFPLLVIGAGGIGSNVVYMAASLGFEHITVYEPDVVEAENIAPQFYRTGDTGELKINALRFTINDMLNTSPLRTYAESYARQSEVARIVLIGVDNMPTRRRIWKQNRIDGKRWWIEGRMGGTMCTIYCVDLQDSKQVAEYEVTLGDPDGQLPCGEKATAFLTKGMIPGMIGCCLFHIVRGSKPPFLQMFDAVTMHREIGWR